MSTPLVARFNVYVLWTKKTEAGWQVVLVHEDDQHLGPHGFSVPISEEQARELAKHSCALPEGTTWETAQTAPTVGDGLLLTVELTFSAAPVVLNG